MSSSKQTRMDSDDSDDNGDDNDDERIEKGKDTDKDKGELLRATMGYWEWER